VYSTPCAFVSISCLLLRNTLFLPSVYICSSYTYSHPCEGFAPWKGTQVI